jgi:hypothetical protein
VNSVSETVALYESMSTAQLVELRAAFEMDIAYATSDRTRGFASVRIDLIDDVLAERKATT